MRISDWSSDVCSSDLAGIDVVGAEGGAHQFLHQPGFLVGAARRRNGADGVAAIFALNALELGCGIRDSFVPTDFAPRAGCDLARSEEHTSDIKALMRIWYAVFCLQKKTENTSYVNTYK